MMVALAQAIRILTIIPIGSGDDETVEFASAAQFFPLIGGLVALISGAVYAAFGASSLGAVLAIAASVVLTGALHEDGLADSADGLLGGATRDDRLRIMKDSRIGTFGALALIVSVALRVTALAQFAMPQALILLIAAHGFGRTASVAAMVFMPYAGSGSKLAASEDRVPARSLWLAGLFGLWPVILLDPVRAASAFGAAAVSAGLVAILAMRRIGGRTGDVLGAIEQAGEIGLWLGAALAVQR